MSDDLLDLAESLADVMAELETQGAALSSIASSLIMLASDGTLEALDPPEDLEEGFEEDSAAEELEWLIEDLVQAASVAGMWGSINYDDELYEDRFFKSIELQDVTYELDESGKHTGNSWTTTDSDATDELEAAKSSHLNYTYETCSLMAWWMVLLQSMNSSNVMDVWADLLGAERVFPLLNLSLIHI